MNKKIPKYYVELNNIITYLIFVMFFSILFVNVFSPFDGQWFIEHNGVALTKYQNFLYSVIIVFGGIVIMALSRALMIIIHKHHALSYLEFGAWLIIEVVIMAMVYTTICHYGLDDNRPFAEIFGRTIIYIPIILLIPSIITALCLEVKARDVIIANLLEKTVCVQDKTAKSAIGESESIPKQEIANGIINFVDEKKILQLSAKIDNVYYLKASDNYIHIYYLDKDNLCRFILRSSMRKQEERLAKYGFIRCHRSYIVNFSKIVLMRKEKDGLYLDLGHKDLKEIPVSKTYLNEVTSHFTMESS